MLYKEFIFEKNSTLGDVGEEYYFGMPFTVIPDSSGNIYVADDQLKKILVFNAKGKFIYSFGRSGRGPGEFLKTSSMVLLPDEKLLVFDFFMRRFTKFSLKGEVLDTYVLPKGEYMDPELMIPLNNEIIATYYRLPEGKNREIPPEQDFLIHLLKIPEFEIVKRFVPVAHTIDTNKNFERYFEGGIFKGLFTFNDSLLTLAPFFYRGKILQYQQNDYGWELHKTFEGYRETERVYVEYDDPEDVIGLGLLSNPRQYGPLLGIMKNESLGIFQKQNGDFLHLGLLEIGDEQKLYVNLFDRSGKLKHHGPVTNLHPGPKEDKFYQRMRFTWMDKKDQLYVIDGTRDGFKIYRGTLELKE